MMTTTMTISSIATGLLWLSLLFAAIVIAMWSRREAKWKRAREKLEAELDSYSYLDGDR